MPIRLDVTSVTDLARDLAQQVAIRADAADLAGRLPSEDVQVLKDSGYLAISIPTEYGGLGLSLRDSLAAQLELAQGSPSTALVAGMQVHLFGSARENRPWPEAMFERLCREAVNGGLVNAAASEPELGSPSRGGLYATTAAPHPDGWIVSGHKNWTTGGQHLTHILVRASLDGDSALLLVPGDAPGIRWEATWSSALSLRASDSHDLFLDGVIVPPDNLLEKGVDRSRPPDAWFPVIMASVYLGAALAARDAVIFYALQRVPTALGKPIATLPKIQRQIGEIDVMLQAAQGLLFEAAASWGGDAETRRQQFPHIVAARHFAVETANQVTEKALRIAGGLSITRALPLERYFRDTRAGLMQPPSGDTALEIVGQNAIDRLKNR
jgi:alkylation response protein AidB-like acyl-CoA dehydrogenase